MSKTPPIAIVGVSSLFPGSEDVLGFWRDVISATDRIGDVPPSHWLMEDYYDADPSVPDMTYAKRGGFLNPISFDPMEFAIPPMAIPATDTVQLLSLIAAQRVLADASRFREGEIDRSRVSVILGVASATELVVQLGSRLQHPIWRKALREAGLPESKVMDIVKRIGDHYQPWQENSFPGLLGNVVAGRIANRFDLGGSNFVTDAACASSISALQAGLSELYLGDSDMVITGGVDALNDILMYMCFSKTPAFSPTGDCRPFSDEADGTLIGEGVGMLALRRLEDAEADGDPIYAVIKGLGASSDGSGSSVYAPRPEGQANALLRAYDKAGYSPATVELIEAHGTATKAGDVAEVGGLTSVFAPSNPDGQAWCALGSVKSQIGHTKAAAGSAGLIKTALALHHKVLPPTLKVSQPNAKLGIGESPFYVNTEARPWIRGTDHPRRAGVSSFGFGGSNFHVTVEEYTGPGRTAPRLRAWPDELVVLSGDAPADLRTALLDVQARIDAGHPLGLIAHDATVSFTAEAEARVALVASTLEELATKVSYAVRVLDDGQDSALPDRDVHFGFGQAEKGRVAFLFPGQGSQYVGMGAAAAMTFDSVRAVWDAAADLETFAEAPLDRAVFPPPAFSDEERAAQLRSLTAMATAQPAIAAVSLGYLSLLKTLGVEADVMAGHSFGEVTALAAAGRLDSADLLSVARRRGELMAEAAADTAGAMLAVVAGREQVEALLGDAPDVVVANDNAPNEVVLAGPSEAIEEVHLRFKAEGITAIPLEVASAFHSSIVAGSCGPFHEFLGSVAWKKGSTEVYSNTTAQRYPKTSKAARRLLADQVASGVRFREMIEAMYAAGVTHFIEVGPGGVLTKLVGGCLGSRPHVAVGMDDKRSSGLRALWRGLGKLAAAGLDLSLDALGDGYGLPDAPQASKAHAILISGTNYAKPYPPAEGTAGLPAPNPEVAPAAAPAMLATPQAAQAPVATPAPSPQTGLPTPVAAPVQAPVQAAQGAPPAQSDLHQSTIDAHRHYQNLMADSHRAFLELAAQAMGGSGPLAGGQQAVQSQQSVPTQAAVPVQVPAPPLWPSEMTGLTPPPAPAATHVPAPTAMPMPAPTGAAPVAPAAPDVAAPDAAAPDVATLALAVVSEKTGYPVEMLNLDMDMEQGLGIDSIKQVEILSELKDRMPGMPDIEPSELAGLRTLRDVAETLGGFSQAEPAASSAPAASPAPAPNGIDPTEIALAVVAEKTGYPVEMLNLDMEMEQGLGIDSIKQVEILSEIRARVPGMDEIEPSELAGLRTLRDVADKLGPATPATQTPTAQTPPTQTPAAPTANPAQVALEVVAEKTGYPVEMLNLDMDMEQGLGIDSIKQVEILSEIRERVPGMPEIDPSQLTGLRTLGDVANMLGPIAPTAQTPSAPTADPAQVALEVVAEKTGYPVEMLNLDMDMEQGLGIDSIKQVEILSEIRERVPGMPEIDPSQLTGLRTLGDVAALLGGAADSEASPTPVTPEATTSAPVSTEAASTTDGASPSPAVPLAGAEGPVAAFIPRPVQEARPGFGLAALSANATVRVTDEHPALAAAIAAELQARDIPAEVGPVTSGDSAVILLAGLAHTAPDADIAMDVHWQVMAAAQVVAQHADPSERMLVTVQSTGGDFGLVSDPGARAWISGLAGIVKTAAREWPGASVKAVDVADLDSAATEVVDEILLGGPALEVGIDAQGVRRVVRMDAAPLDGEGIPALEPGSVVVVSGGARGVTASSAAKLAEEWGVRLALLGRSTLDEWPEGVPLSTDPVEITGALASAASQRGDAVDLPSLQQQARTLAASAAVRLSLADLDARGIEAMYLSADVGDADQVGAALDHVRERWGPIAGIVHGAGVLRDKPIAEMSADRVADVFRPKVTGLSVLLASTRNDPLRLIALFSSIAARAGNAGQAAYSAANEVLNKVAAAEASRRGDACRVRSYNWGPWAGGMVDAGLAAHFEKQGVALLDVDAGSQYFVDELARSGSGVERVVLAAPSFPSVEHRLTVTAAWSDDDQGDGGAGVGAGVYEAPGEPALLADMALRIGHTLKPVSSMRTSLEDFVVRRVTEAAAGSDGRIHFVDVSARDGATPGHRVVFRDIHGTVRCETQIRYSAPGTEPTASVHSGDLEPWAIDSPDTHQALSSRGAGFRSIVDLRGISKEGGLAFLRARVGRLPLMTELGFDPATLDDLFQLAALWTHQQAGAAQTLASMGTVIVHQLEGIPGRMRSAFHARRTATGTLFDFTLATEEGDLVAELREVEFATENA